MNLNYSQLFCTQNSTCIFNRFRFLCLHCSVTICQIIMFSSTLFPTSASILLKWFTYIKFLRIFEGMHIFTENEKILNLLFQGGTWINTQNFTIHLCLIPINIRCKVSCKGCSNKLIINCYKRKWLFYLLRRGGTDSFFIWVELFIFYKFTFSFDQKIPQK